MYIIIHVIKLQENLVIVDLTFLLVQVFLPKPVFIQIVFGLVAIIITVNTETETSCCAGTFCSTGIAYFCHGIKLFLISCHIIVLHVLVPACVTLKIVVTYLTRGPVPDIQMIWNYYLFTCYIGVV